MKNAIKWVFTHEPALLAGVVAGIAIFFSVRYGTHAGGALQGLSGGTTALIFGTLRNFVTSPAGRKALDQAQADVAQIPSLVADVNAVKTAVWPALTHPAGLPGVLATHADELRKAGADMVDRVQGMLRTSQTAAAATTVPEAAPVPAAPEAAPVADAAPTPAAPDALAQLGQLVGS